jgi:hypothetical protein
LVSRINGRTQTEVISEPGAENIWTQKDEVTGDWSKLRIFGPKIVEVTGGWNKLRIFGPKEIR